MNFFPTQSRQPCSDNMLSDEVRTRIFKLRLDYNSAPLLSSAKRFANLRLPVSANARCPMRTLVHHLLALVRMFGRTEKD